MRSPRVQAMVLCDDVAEADEEIGVYHLMGVRTVVEAPSFPTVHSLCVFAQMSNFVGQANCHIEIASSDGDHLVDDTEPQAIQFDDQIEIVPVVFRKANCVIPTAGVYLVEIYHDNKVIGERRLTFRIEG